MKELTFGGMVVRVVEACESNRDTASDHSSEMRIALRGYTIEEGDGVCFSSGSSGESVGDLEVVLKTTGVLGRLSVGSRVTIAIRDLGIIPLKTAEPLSGVAASTLTEGTKNNG